MPRIPQHARRNRSLPALAALAIAGLLLVTPAPPAVASGIGTARLTVDFTRPEAARDLARWSLPQQIGCTAEGLGWDGPADSSYDAEVHVTEALPAGRTWWAATNASLRVTLRWSAWEERHVPGHLYVRHSPDARHWSEWMPLAAPRPGASPDHVYTLALNAPRPAAQTWATTLRSRYLATDPPARERTDVALAAWVERSHPGYLAREMPFFGYLQFLLSCDMRSGIRLRSLAIEETYVTPGPYGPPPSDVVDGCKPNDTHWNFRAEPLALREASAQRTRTVREVLSAALRALVAASRGGPEADGAVARLVLCDRTAITPEIHDLELDGRPAHEPSFEALTPDTKLDHVRRNRTSRLLPSGVDAGVEIEAIGAYGADFLLRGGHPGRPEPKGLEWRSVHNSLHQGSLGLVWVSEPGFSADGQQAVVHVSHMQRLGVGEGRFFLLQQGQSGWTVVATQPTWKR